MAGEMRKKNTAEDLAMIIRSIGESWQTDKTTGKQMSRVGTMDVHFNQNCLELFDTENFYGPAKRFDFSRMTINEDNHRIKQKRKERAKRFGHNIFVTDITRH